MQLEIQFREKVQVSAEQAKLSAEAAEAAKTRFLANMSHGMKNINFSYQFFISHILIFFPK